MCQVRINKRYLRFSAPLGYVHPVSIKKKVYKKQGQRRHESSPFERHIIHKRPTFRAVRSKSQAAAIATPTVEGEHLTSALLLLAEVFGDTATDLSESRPHNLPECSLRAKSVTDSKNYKGKGRRPYLVLCIEGHDTNLVRPHNRLTSSDDTRTGIPLQLVRRQKQQETALQKVDSKEEWHETQVRVILEDIGSCLSGADGMTHC